MAPYNPNRLRTTPSDALEGLKLNEPGLRALRRALGEGDTYQRYKHRFDAADIAWLAQGAHSDNRHSVVPSRFHPDWSVARQVQSGDREEARRARNELKVAVKNVVFDMITTLDRITGGSSYFNHVDGAIQPGQNFSVESIKMDVYLTPHLLDEVPDFHPFAADITQRFAKTIGVHTIMRWCRAFKKEGYSLPPVPDAHPPSYVAQRPFMPAPIRGTSHYICYGRRLGELEAMIAQLEDADDSDGSVDGHDVVPQGRRGPLAAPPSVDDDYGHDSGQNGPEVELREDSDTLGSPSVKDGHANEVAVLQEYIRSLEETIERKDEELSQLRLQLSGATFG
ncbi:hypothetical protein FKP32DRAFT_1670397 [Trametes sanguinea]|nr:hypothetical protein FKP32DRAFT_1670397 [Trametes sanguinea]